MTQHWFKTLFAATGTKTAVPDAADPSGFISYDTGYGPDYQRVLGTDPLAKTIERDKLNQVLYDMTGAIQQYQTHAFPEFITTANNGGTPFAYDVDAIVRYDSGGGFNLYQNTTSSNTNIPTGAGWVLKSGGLASIASPTFTGTPTAPNFSYKPTPVTVTSWNYVSTTITLNVASHTFVAGDYIEVGGLTATTNIPNGVHLVTSVTATTIVFTYALTPTGTAGVSSATVKGYMTTNGRTNGIGEGQTWQDITGSRALGTTYTNTTGKSIMIKVTITASPSGFNGYFVINGMSQNIFGAGSNLGLYSNDSIIVPNGDTYSLVAINTNLSKWMELK